MNIEKISSLVVLKESEKSIYRSMIDSFEQYNELSKVVTIMKTQLKNCTENTNKDDIMYMIIKYDNAMNKLEEFKEISNRYAENYLKCRDHMNIVAANKIISTFRSFIINKRRKE